MGYGDDGPTQFYRYVMQGDGNERSIYLVVNPLPSNSLPCRGLL